MLDGSIDEDFIHIVGVVQFGSFSWINMLPPSIVVGIANVDRKRDFTYPTRNEIDKKYVPTGGGAAQFIDFLAKEAQPLIKQQYKTDTISTIIGQSLGGLLALNAGIESGEKIAALVSLAAPLWLETMPTNLIRTLEFFPVLQRVIPSLPKLSGSDIRDTEMKAANPSYPVIPTRGLIQLNKLMIRVRSKLDLVVSPLLIVHSKQDHTAPFESAVEIHRRASSDQKHLHLLEESFHLIAMDTEYLEVAQRIRTFFTKALGWTKHK